VLGKSNPQEAYELRTWKCEVTKKEPYRRKGGFVPQEHSEESTRFQCMRTKRDVPYQQEIINGPSEKRVFHQDWEIRTKWSHPVGKRKKFSRLGGKKRVPPPNKRRK